ncbi:hypothetical protein BaRGS_00018198, partial [Batillaria attramentaria]
GLDFSKPWHNDFVIHKERLLGKLHLVHPAMRTLLNMCQVELGNLVLADCSKYRGDSTLEYDSWKNSVSLELEKSEEKLMQSWFPDVVALFSDKKQLNLPHGKSTSFFNSVNTLISNQLMDMKVRTIEHYAELFEHDNRLKLPVLRIELVLDEGVMTFYPPVTDFEQLVSSIMYMMAKTMSKVPTVQSWLAGGETLSFTDSHVATHIITMIQFKLETSALKLFEGPMLHLQGYIDKYEYLINGTALAEVEKFLSEKHDLPSVAFYDTFRLDCDDLKLGLVEAARGLANKLLMRVVDDHRRANKKTIDGFEEIKRRALHVPETSEQLMEMVEFVADASIMGMFKLMQQIQEAYTRLKYLMDVHLFTADDIQLQTEVFNWPVLIDPVFDQHEVLAEKSKHQNEVLLAEKTKKVHREIEKLKQRMDEFNDFGELDMIQQYIKDVMAVQRRIDAVQELIEWINKEEALFKFPITKYPEVHEIQQTLEPFMKIFTLVFKWQKSEKKWMDGYFLELDGEAIEAEVDEYMRDLFKLQKVFAKAHKKALGEWEDRQREAKKHRQRLLLTVEDPTIKVSNCIQGEMKTFKESIPLIVIMCNPGIRDRHWKQMSQIAGFDLTPDAGTTLRKVQKLELEPFLDKFEVISGAATKEYSLEKATAKMQHEWEGVQLSLTPYRDTGISILASIEEIQRWEEQLNRCQDAMDEWLKVQAQWLYLEPIFCSEDIMQQMPEEGRLFQAVDKNWKDIMRYTVKKPDALATASMPGLLEKLLDCNSMLDKINKGLNAYLEKKRLFFPRFFFLSNDEMLEILSETKDPLRVQPHLKKCFEGIAKLEFDRRLDIHGMFSSEGEHVKFSKTISTSEARGAVEKWLLQVQDVMLMSVRDVVEAAVEDYPEAERNDWVRAWPGQVVLCGSQVYWTREVHEAIQGGPEGLKEYHGTLQDQLKDIVALVRGKLTKQQRTTLGALVVIDVHARDVVMDMAQKGVATENDFNWLSQLRYYWEDDTMLVRITNATVDYCNEYLGNSGRLVITPLTDRCYRTLVGAFHLNLNGAPEGPAGTGKTETTKDLAKALAVQCVVFNCSDGLDYIAMGKFFKGLASAGAWACFDEFNRIDVEVLSVVAQQILCIIRAVQEHVDEFIFEGTRLKLNPNCYVCITMNPGYAGRSELPDNLKVLFRTVAMMVPDYAMIAEISLYSFGFLDARNLSVKIVTTYRLCSEQLSSQFHYDYGMRAVKAVLCAAGNLKLKFPDEEENILLLRSIMDVNLPKFLSHDIPLFNGIISDLFPGLQLPQADYVTFLDAMKREADKLNLQFVDFFIEKIIQTYEMMIVRHGFMLVGYPFGGKTCVLNTLRGGMSMLNREGHEEYEAVIERTVNPKSITMGQLYGQFDPVSHEWTDGIIANTFREFASSETPDRKWVVFDGPIDAVWIENMNTVLDDNKKLCLMSGEIIQMSNVMSLIFECHDLSQASPATVSRCGMVYLEPVALGWRPLMRSWLNTQPELYEKDWLEMLEHLFEWLVDACMDFVRHYCKEYSGCGAANKVMSMMKFIDMLMHDSVYPEDEQHAEHHMKYLHSWLLVGPVILTQFALVPFAPSQDRFDPARLALGSVLWAIPWSLAGGMDSDGRRKFDVFYRELLHGKMEEYPMPPGLKIEVPLPPEHTAYDYFYEHKSRGSWKPWHDLIKHAELGTTNVREMLVPTIDTARYSFIMDLCIKHNRPLLFVGPTGTGKSAYVQQKLMLGVPTDKYISNFVNFSAQTSANQTQNIIMSKLDKRRKGVFGPQVGKRMMIFVDDLNMPAKEIYGAQPPIELLRQYLDFGNWIILQDIQLMSAMGPPGGGRNDVTPRFLRHFSIVSMNPFDNETMNKIFTTIMSTYMRNQGFMADYIAIGNNIVHATLDMYEAAMANLLPTPAKSHYVFNLRDFSRVVLGVCLIQKTEAHEKRLFIRLWVHEVMRVFYDRLTDDTDRAWLFNTVKNLVAKHFKEGAFDVIFEHLANDGAGGKCREEDLRSLMFGDFLDPDALPEERVYQEVTYVLEHLSRICRVLRVPGGNALLVGVGGSGRQSLTRLATAMAGYHLFQPEISKNYGKNEWREDVKSILKAAGAHGKPTSFLITDTQIKEESFLEDIDSLLNTGEVANLFASDEKAEIMEAVRVPAQRGDKNKELTPLQLFAFFVSRCKANLHIMIAFSPIGDAFRNRLRQFPSLINCCTIDWFQPWPDDALERVANKFLETSDIEPSVKEETIWMCKYFHQSVRHLSLRYLMELGRHNYVTPTSYLELINAFKTLLQKKQDETMAAKTRYVVGLDKLAFAASQ